MEEMLTYVEEKKKEKTPTGEIQPHRGNQDNWAEEEAILYLKRNF